MLKSEDRLLLRTRLALLIPHPTTPIGIAVWLGGDSTLALGLPSFSSRLEVAEWIIDVIERHPTPGLLINMIQLLHGDLPQMQGLLAFANSLAAAPNRWVVKGVGVIDWGLAGDPLELDSDRPFIDRASVRRFLPRVGETDSPACLLVRGQQGEGKSYFRDYCVNLAKQRGVLRIGTTEFSGRPGQMSAYIPARKLAGGLGIKERAPRHPEPFRRAKNLAQWLTLRTRPGSLPSLAIFDGYDHPEVTEPVHAFIGELCKIVTSEPSVNAKLRVILLGYDTGRLERLKVKFKPVVFERIEESHVHEWFRARYPGKPDFQYDDVVQEIFRSIPSGSSDPLRLTSLCLHVAELGMELAT